MWLRLISFMGLSPRQSIQNCTRVAVLMSPFDRLRVCQTMKASAAWRSVRTGSGSSVMTGRARPPGAPPVRW
jgi:hypothetical protein